MYEEFPALWEKMAHDLAGYNQPLYVCLIMQQCKEHFLASTHLMHTALALL